MSNNENDVSAFVQMKPVVDGKRTGLMVKWSMSVLTKNEGEGLACFVPGFDFYFDAKDKDDSVRKTRAFGRMYFDNFFIHSKNGLKKVVLELHKMGFKASNDADTIHKLINNKPVHANFKKPNLSTPAGFDLSNDIVEEQEMCLSN